MLSTLSPMQSGYTALARAAAEGQDDCVSALLSAGSKAATAGQVCSFQIYSAACVMACIPAPLVMTSSRPPAQGGCELSPLVLAADAGHHSCVQLLLAALPDSADKREARIRLKCYLESADKEPVPP